jgi:hypothetical protein
VRSFIEAVPLFPVVLAVGTIVAVLSSAAVGRWLRTNRVVACLLVAGFVLVASATLLPTASALSGIASNGSCDLSRLGIATFGLLSSDRQTQLNVVLFVPLGVAVALLPYGARTVAVAGTAVLLPFIIEGIQLAAPTLGRDCQSADVIDNLMGLGLGIAVGLGVRIAIGAGRSAGR